MAGERKRWLRAAAVTLAACASPHDQAIPTATATATATTTTTTTPTPTATPTPTPTPTSSAVSGAPKDCPVEMARIGRFCIDRWEAHLVSEGADGLAVHPHFERPAEGVRYLARSARDVFPQAYISRNEAQAACEAAGKRLCTFREWRRACQGKRTRLYPYGNAAKRGTCNDGKKHLLPQLFGGDARRWEYDKHFNSPLLDQQEGYLAKTGAYPDCASEEGVLDLVGNLHEWVSGQVTEELMDRLDEEPVERHDQHWQTGNGIFVGGFFSTTNELGPGCYYTTVAHEPSYHDYSTGFRCCMDAPPEPKPDKPPPKRPPKR